MPQPLQFEQIIKNFCLTGNGRLTQVHCIVGYSIPRSVLCSILHIFANVVNIHTQYVQKVCILCTKPILHTSKLVVWKYVVLVIEGTTHRLCW